MRLSARICWGLIVLTVLIYLPVARFEFVDYDDNAYVTGNAYVNGGLTMTGIDHAFRTTVLGYWQPLTLISHMVDCQLFGLNPHAHHLVNLAFHVANTVLLFLLLLRLTHSPWRCACVAALFAWHPLHVESVAWIAERKDVLSTLFWTLSIWTYVDHVQGRGRRFYFASLLFFAFGLLSKSMVVTLPCLLLLLDHWPLKRLPLPPIGLKSAEQPDTSWRQWLGAFLPLLKEKIPYFALTAAVSVITFRFQKDAGSFIAGDVLTLDLRIANAFVAYGRYLSKTFWPVDFAVFYPHPGIWPLWMVAGSVLVLLVTTVLVLRALRSKPWLAVGWFWFLGVIFPTVGLVQAGWQSLADHFTYVPLTGVFILVVWAAADTIVHRPHGKGMALGIAIVVLSILAASARWHLSAWSDSFTLFTRSLQSTSNNAVAHMGLGNELVRRGQLPEALTHLHKALEIHPYYADAWQNLGDALVASGKKEEARDAFQRAVKIAPQHPGIRLSLANILIEQGALSEATMHLRKALEMDPSMYEAHNNLGFIFHREGRLDEAIEEYRAVLRLKGDQVQARLGLATVLRQAGKLEEALEQFEIALQASPKDPNALIGRGLTLFRLNRTAEANASLVTAVEVAPSNYFARLNYGIILASQGDSKTALPHLREAVRLKPDSIESLQPLARILATSPDASARNGAEAMRFAQQAVRLSKQPHPLILDTLAAAYAEAGQFIEAIRIQQQAIDLASQRGHAAMVEQMKERLALYEQKRPYHEPPIQR